LAPRIVAVVFVGRQVVQQAAIDDASASWLKEEHHMRTSSCVAIVLAGSWIMASRPQTLPASLSPVIVGTAVAIHDAAFLPLAALAALFAALLIQIGSNFANDLGDYRRGTDRLGRVGPTRVTTAGLLTPEQVKMGMYVVFGLAAVSGLYLISLGGWPILIAGIVSILAAIAYGAEMSRGRFVDLPGQSAA
jgi:1,4-dihydroxy-2-naphthoate octaprenyltransferase